MTDTDFLPFARPDITEAEVEAVSNCVRSGWLTSGKHASTFESEFSAFLGDSSLYSVALNSATAGLHLALEAAGIGPGDEVMVPTWTFTATAEVVRYLGATPIFVDSRTDSLNIDLELAATLVSARTKAIMPVHFAGLAVSYAELQRFAERYSLAVIEDAAHALPATSGGVTVGAGASIASVFSFYATKTITTGEGGMLVTADKQLADRARTMRLHGINRDVFDRYSSKTAGWYYEVVAAGHKYNLTDPAAALGRVQLARALEMRERRAEIAASYFEAFSDMPLVLPVAGTGEDLHAWHLFVIRLSPAAPIDRDSFISKLRAAGIGTSVHFIPLHRQPYWRDEYDLVEDSFPVAEEAFSSVVSLPIYSAMSVEDCFRVIRGVREALGYR